MTDTSPADTATLPANAPAETEATPTFEDLGLSGALLKSLKDVGYEAPTPIQIETLPVLLADFRARSLVRVGDDNAIVAVARGEAGDDEDDEGLDDVEGVEGAADVTGSDVAEGDTSVPSDAGAASGADSSVTVDDEPEADGPSATGDQE